MWKRCKTFQTMLGKYFMIKQIYHSNSSWADTNIEMVKLYIENPVFEGLNPQYTLSVIRLKHDKAGVML